MPPDLADHSQELSIEDPRQLVDHLGIERPALGGFSMGGSIALNFALLPVLPGTGHTLNLEEPAAFNDAVLQFLREVED